MLCENIHPCHYCMNKIDLFSNLPEEVKGHLESKISHLWLEKGKTLFRQGDGSPGIYILHQGKVKLHKYNLEGKETIFDIAMSGDVIGEDFFLDNQGSPYDATTISDVYLCILKAEDFIDILHSYPDATINLINSLMRKLQMANEKSAILSENDAKLRVMKFLYAYSRRQHGRDIELGVDEIAASINLRRETVSRKISELQEEGLIVRLGQSHLRILDRDKSKNFLEAKL